jgi:16S rRNA (cytosine967-C5)-methyltransferase
MPSAATPSRPGRRGTVSAARTCAFSVLRRVFEQGAYADQALHAEAARRRLEPRERPLATRLVYATVQRRATLDHLIEVLAERPVEALDPETRTALRLGLLQIVFLDGVPAHAAVDQTVSLARQARSGGFGLVNAVLRRAVREAPGIVDRLGESTPAEAALRHSHPLWLVEMWWEVLGREAALALLARDNEAAESVVRANTLRTTPGSLRSELAAAGVRSRAAEGLPEGLVLDGPFDAFGSAAWRRGDLMPQSRAAMLVAHVAGPRPGDRVLDLCAAPGAKTTHMAALMDGKGAIVSVERHAGRAAALERTCRRMGAGIVSVRVADAADAAAAGPGSFDRVLVDPPCSDLGTLQARPDARWRKRPEDLERLAARQREILAAGAAALRPGGVLTYSTCTISPRENEELIAGFLAAHPHLRADDLGHDHPLWEHPTVPRHLQTLPHRDRTDGFFIARLRREEA